MGRSRSSPSPSSSDPLAGVELVMVDGNNLLGALARGTAALPPSAAVGRIRAAIPAGTRLELVFDGPPRGGVTGRVASGFGVRYSGRSTADEVILEAVARQAREGGPASTAAILVVSDDRDLRDAARLRGARTAGAGWLASRMAASGGPTGPSRRSLAGTSLGHGRPPRRPPGDPC